MGRRRCRKNRSHKQRNVSFNTWTTFKSQCQSTGTSEEWIKINTVKCPNCYVPIEKDGGCDNVRCTMCGQGFNWVNAKNRRRWKPITFIKIFFYLISFGLFLYISLKMYYNWNNLRFFLFLIIKMANWPQPLASNSAKEIRFHFYVAIISFSFYLFLQQIIFDIKRKRHFVQYDNYVHVFHCVLSILSILISQFNFNLEK